MKYYETNFTDYIKSINEFNLHEDKKKYFEKISDDFNKLSNIIFTGPSGIGKYSQVLSIIQKFSQSDLKYDKKITCYFEKLNYTYRISDIHYEIDMSLLGCNSKQLWNEIFFQIIDIVTIKPIKNAIILCKNFHFINNELLETFYSYMQHTKINPNVNIKFFILTENISFIPYNIINSSVRVNFKRPSMKSYKELFENNKNIQNNELINSDFLNRIISCNRFNNNYKSLKVLNKIENQNIVNIKELKYFDKVDKEIPPELFDTITSILIEEIINFKSSSLLMIRDSLYDILTYNIDIYECIWYIFYYLIDNGYLNKDEDILRNTFLQLKYFNNNYRPIYHLERMFYNIVSKIHNL